MLLLGIGLGVFSHASGAVTVAAVGDSITRGWPYYQDDADGIPNNGGFEPALQSKLNADGWGATVLNYGYPGEFASSGVHRIRPQEYSRAVLKSNPDYVLVMEGTNDLSWYVDWSAIRNSLATMVSYVKEDGSVPLLGTLLPRGGYVNEQVLLTNDAIRQLAKDQDIVLADLYYADDSNWSGLIDSDKIHPNYAGYALMADTWYAALLEYVAKQRAIEDAITRAKISGALSAVNYLLLLTD